MEEIKVLIFVMVDNEGNIAEMIKGANIIPEREYDFFFIRSKEEADLINTNDYKVVIRGFRAELVLKETE